MLISRLLLFSSLVALGAASVSAQSSPEKNPIVAPSTDSEQMNSSDRADLPFLNLRPELDAPNPLDRIRTGEYRPRLNQFGMPHVLILGSDGLSQDDTLCYAMRSYKVARDNPQSDSTHAAGYSTCQPATRFHVHTTEEQVLPPAP
jgi:hypothetical protein